MEPILDKIVEYLTNLFVYNHNWIQIHTAKMEVTRTSPS